MIGILDWGIGGMGVLRALRDKGYRELDAHTPYSTEVVRSALELPSSPLPIFILACAVVGAGLAYLLQWWLVAFLYPVNVGGRPAHMPLAFVPITFEMGVLFAAFGAVFGVLVAGRLLRLWDPVFTKDTYESLQSIKGYYAFNDVDADR